MGLCLSFHVNLARGYTLQLANSTVSKGKTLNKVANGSCVCTRSPVQVYGFALIFKTFHPYLRLMHLPGLVLALHHPGVEIALCFNNHKLDLHFLKLSGKSTGLTCLIGVGSDLWRHARGALWANLGVKRLGREA